MSTKAKSAKSAEVSKQRSAKSSSRTTIEKRQPPTKRANRSAEAKSTTRESSKISKVAALLRRKEGATIKQLVKATGWQSHSVRGAMSGALKKKLGLKITSSKTDDVRVYRIAG